MGGRKGPSVYIKMKSNYLKMILRGTKLIEENKYQSKPYNYYKYYLGAIGFLYFFEYLSHNYMRAEYDMREHPNVLIPKSLYYARRQHYIYWDISRVARGLNKTFSYHNYDPTSKLLYFVDRKGNNYVEKILFNEERPDLIENPFLEYLNNRKPWNDSQLERANKISAYYLNINRRYDLDNYLHYKSVNLGDYYRWINYYFMIKTKYGDVYRNEQYIAKSDLRYDYEYLLINSNLNSLDKEKVKENLFLTFLTMFMKIVKSYTESEEDDEAHKGDEK